MNPASLENLLHLICSTSHVNCTETVFKAYSFLHYLIPKAVNSLIKISVTGTAIVISDSERSLYSYSYIIIIMFLKCFLGVFEIQNLNVI